MEIIKEAVTTLISDTEETEQEMATTRNQCGCDDTYCGCGL